MTEQTAEQTEQPQLSLDLATLCCACDDPLGTERPLVTLLCLCRAHTECFLRDLGAKQHTDVLETCPRCRTNYYTEELLHEVHQMAAAAEIEEENIRREMNSCFILNEGSPEFVTDLARCKEIAKAVNTSQKDYTTFVSGIVKKYKEDTKVMANVIKSTRKDALLKINAAPCTKLYHSNVSRFCSYVSRMARRYDFSHGEWMRFTRRKYPVLYRSFYRYNRHTYNSWSMRRKFRYGL
jgi:hypothetical protein